MLRFFIITLILIALLPGVTMKLMLGLLVRPYFLLLLLLLFLLWPTFRLLRRA
jgi:hypothetical protein